MYVDIHNQTIKCTRPNKHFQWEWLLTDLLERLDVDDLVDFALLFDVAALVRAHDVERFHAVYEAVLVREVNLISVWSNCSWSQNISSVLVAIYRFLKVVDRMIRLVGLPCRCASWSCRGRWRRSGRYTWTLMKNKLANFNLRSVPLQHTLVSREESKGTWWIVILGWLTWALWGMRRGLWSRGVARLARSPGRGGSARRTSWPGLEVPWGWELSYSLCLGGQSTLILPLTTGVMSSVLSSR